MNNPCLTKEELRELLQDPKFINAVIEEHNALHPANQAYYDNGPSDEELLLQMFAENRK